MGSFRSFLLDEDASTAVEYAVMLALIVAVCVVSITAVGEAAYEALWDAVEVLD
jgi:pilus assembly protein Flp/PilA